MTSGSLCGAGWNPARRLATGASRPFLRVSVVATCPNTPAISSLYFARFSKPTLTAVAAVGAMVAMFPQKDSLLLAESAWALTAPFVVPLMNLVVTFGRMAMEWTTEAMPGIFRMRQALAPAY